MPSDSDGGGTPAPTPTTPGRGGGNNRRNRGHGGRGGRGRGGGRGPPQRPRFTGEDSAMQGHTFDVRSESKSDQFLKTQKFLANYVGRKYTENAAEFVHAVKELELDDPEEPDEPDEEFETPTAIQIKKWEAAYKRYKKKLEAYRNFKATLYSLVIGQCSPALQEKLRAHNDFEGAHMNGVELLKIIRTLTHSFEDIKELSDSVVTARMRFYGFRQRPGQPLQEYYEQFLGQVEMLEQAGVTLIDEALAMQEATRNQRAEPSNADVQAAKQRALATHFIIGARRDLYGDFLGQMRNDYLSNQDIYPKTLQEAYAVLENRVHIGPRFVPQYDATAFATHGEESDLAGIRCYNCQEMGHYANDCTNPHRTRAQGPASGDNEEEATQMLMSGVEGATSESPQFSFSQAHGRNIPATWILLDNQSTVDIFKNKALLSNIREVQGTMTVHCNAGTRVTKMQGDLPGYGTVWYDPKGIANILSLRQVRKKYHVQYDSGKDDAFLVTKPDGKQFRFMQSTGGLYVLDTADSSGVVLVNTVADNTTRYTNADYSRAKQARELQIKIGRPSTKQFLKIIDRNLLKNCPVSRADVLAAEDIFGPDVGSLKGKTVRRKPHRVRPVFSNLPTEVMARYKDVTLTADVMFVNEIPFLVTKSRNIHLGTVSALENRSSATLMKAIRPVLNIYRRGGFTVRTMLMDGEFIPIRGELATLGVALNETGRDEHVGDIERYIRTVKERCRSVYCMLPFKQIPGRMLIELVKYSVFWLNSFPHERGISDTLSPRAIVCGQSSVDCQRHCKYEFGQYVQAHEQHDNTIDNKRTVGAIALRPTGNDQGNYFFLSLLTGRVLNRTHATKLPMPGEVIERVHLLAQRQNAQPGLVFADREHVPLDGADDDGDVLFDVDDDDDPYYPTDDYDDDSVDSGVYEAENYHDGIADVEAYPPPEGAGGIEGVENNNYENNNYENENNNYENENENDGNFGNENENENDANENENENDRNEEQIDDGNVENEEIEIELEDDGGNQHNEMNNMPAIIEQDESDNEDGVGHEAGNDETDEEEVEDEGVDPVEQGVEDEEVEDEEMGMIEQNNNESATGDDDDDNNNDIPEIGRAHV